MYRAAFAKTNDANVAYILHRKNGIDIQIISKKEHGEVTSYGFYDKTLHPICQRSCHLNGLRGDQRALFHRA
jgi:hypothetical protein